MKPIVRDYIREHLYKYDSFYQSGSVEDPSIEQLLMLRELINIELEWYFRDFKE